MDDHLSPLCGRLSRIIFLFLVTAVTLQNGYVVNLGQPEASGCHFTDGEFQLMRTNALSLLLVSSLIATTATAGGISTVKRPAKEQVEVISPRNSADSSLARMPGATGGLNRPVIQAT